MLHKTLLVVLAAFTLAACETVDGAGRDVQNTGEAISDTAQDVQASI